ncbi:MAG: Arc family DNA-binding protein [Clostridia bacterium]|nr:Arc family DNA-binding protein [Clostridia bacterium]
MGNYYSPFSLRVSEELIEEIKSIAKKNKRSTNKEIELALENHVREYENLNGKVSI